MQYRFLTQHTENGVVVLSFTEPLLNADAVKEAVSVINADESRKVIIDCQTVRFLVSGSLFPDREPFTPLLNLNRQLTEVGGRLVLCNVAADFAEVLRVTRLNQILKIRPNVEMAVACMNESAESRTYSHTQKAPLCLILYGSALLCFVLAVTVGDTPGLFIAGGVGFLMILIGPCFHHLTVEDQGDRLGIRFGPVPLFARTVNYADIELAEVGRTTILDGWGIHYSLRGGWVWNIWGRDCVVVHFKKGGVLRIGTDDAEGLAGFLESRTTEVKQ